ncbi:MAG: GTP-binding protein EngB [Candidatus Thorarchaeota archaeon]|nr:GTP-binding protein EngB [Candidatus Thorarchaeota archaeon]
MHRQDSSGIEEEEEKPLVVFAGRSNVGKSSLIRLLTGKKVRVGKKPGSTTWEIPIDMGPVVFIDIPGFGFMAKRSKSEIEEMKTTIVKKLESWSDRLVLAVLILDVSLFREIAERWESRGEIPIDIEFYTFLSEISPQVIVVGNKIDKVKKREQQRTIEYVTQRLGEEVPDRPLNLVITSATKREGISDLKYRVEEALKRKGIGKLPW